MGEIKKIRIGNDIRLAVDLRQYINKYYTPGHIEERRVYSPKDSSFNDKDDNDYLNNNEVYYPYDYNTEAKDDAYVDFKSTPHPISIRYVEAYLINTTKIEDRQRYMKDRKNFITRYPVEPYMNAFDSTAYDICGDGIPTWNYRPFPHRIVPYGGFGVNPRFDGIYKLVKVWDDFKYRAQTYATAKLNVIEVSFPASAQKYTGVYKMVIVAKVYAPGFNSANLKTITVDIDDVFELTESLKGSGDTGVQVKVNLIQDILPAGDDFITTRVDDKYLYTSQFDEKSNTVDLEMNDGEIFNVSLDSRLGWYCNED